MSYKTRVRSLSNRNTNRAKSNISRRHLKVGVRRGRNKPHSGKAVRGSSIRRKK